MSKSKSKEKSRQRRGEIPTLYDRLGLWCSAHARQFLIACLVIGAALSLAQFDVKPSIGGDDTAYVLQAMKIVAKGELSVSFRTPGYPLLLALFVWIGGMNLIFLKLTSFAFFVGLIFSFYIVFKDRLEPQIFYPALLLTAINPLVIEYSYQTYSEMFFALVTIWAIHFVLKSAEEQKSRNTVLGGLLTMAAFYVRIVGVTIAGAAGLYYVLRKQWKSLGVFVAVCLLLYSPLKIYQTVNHIDSFEQASILLLKNPYNVTEGKETVGGFVQRFVNNVVNDLNYQIPTALSLPTSDELSIASGRLLPDGMAILALIFSLIVAAGLKVAIVDRPYRHLRPIGIFIIGYLAFVALALQNLFATPRMLMPIVPYLVICLLLGWRWSLMRLARKAGVLTLTSGVKGMFVVGLAFVTLTNVVQLNSKIASNLPILQENLSGNQFAGFTPDWVNYLKASEWIGRNLPKNGTIVMCRKPELFQIYNGGYEAYGTYMIDQTNADSLVAHWRNSQITHLLYDNFQWSSTLRRYVQPVAEKYPKLFVLIHQEGNEYPSYVYRLNYAVVDSMNNRMGAFK
jgi:4-amino-4-deoxy-L-arabinose transferase-like glycosyltransferase